MAETLEVQVKQILDAYDAEVQKIADATMESVADEAVKQLKVKSPRKSGKYRRGWKCIKEIQHGVKTFIICNPSNAYKTHLLNNGHVIRNKYGAYGRKQGDNHIGLVADWANQEAESRIKRELSK